MEKYQDNVQNRNGKAVEGASVRVHTYPDGALATIYSDNGITPAANPLTTDANGRFFFYAADGRYSLVIYGAGLDPTTFSDISIAEELPPAIAADLANASDAAKGAALLGFLQAGAGAVGQTALAQLRVIVTPENFGAAGDGIASDTTKLTSALAYLTSIGGGTLILRAGAVYGVRDLTIPANIHVIGHGENSRFRFLPSGNDANDAASWAIHWTGANGSLVNFVIDGQYTGGSSSRRVGNGLRILADSNGLKRKISGIKITGFSGYKAGAVGGTFGVSRNFARADITDDAGNHLLTGGNGVKCDTSGGAAAWELHVDGLVADTLDGIGCDWSNITDSTFSNVIAGNCVYRGWVETGANNQRDRIKVYRSMMLNCRDDFNTSVNKIIPHQATVGADNLGTVLLAGQRLQGSMEAQENGSHGFCLGTRTQTLQHSTLCLTADGNGGIDGAADATTNDNYRRYGIFARSYFDVQLSGVCDDFRARYNFPRQLRGLHVISAAGRSQITTTGEVTAATVYRIKANAGGADFTPMQIGVAAPSNAVGTVFAARQIFGASFPPAGTTFGSGGVIEPANDRLQASLMIANQYEQDQGTGPGYSVTGDNGISHFVFNGAEIVHSLTVSPSLSTDNAIQVAVKGESNSRLAIQGAKINFGNGSGATDGALDRLGTNLIGTPSGLLFRGATIGTAAPATTPTATGLVFVDTTNKKMYVSTGTASSADWTILN